MTAVQTMSQAGDRVMARLVAGLEIEFGRGAGAALAQRFIEAEECDFCWDARIEERWIGAYEGGEEEGLNLDRVRILGWLDGRWFVAAMIVDGDGNARGMFARQDFKSRDAAQAAFANG